MKLVVEGLEKTFNDYLIVEGLEKTFNDYSMTHFQ